jgi:hypothetical protein
VLAPQGLHEEGQEPSLRDDGKDADGGDEHGHGLLREVHDEPQVDEETRILAWKRKKIRLHKRYLLPYNIYIYIACIYLFLYLSI